MRSAMAGTAAGQWSARKAQMAVQMYKAQGGRYKGPKDSANSLVRWTRQRWRTRSGRPSHVTGERYLPEAAIRALSARQYAATTAAKRRSMLAGRQFSPQPRAISNVTRRYRR